MGETAIEVRGLTKIYDRQPAIEELDFTVRAGEVVGFLGPNGAGKSTTLRIVSGLMMANRGTVRLCGIPVASQPERSRLKVGFMPENNPLPEDMRVIEYLRYRAALKQVPAGQRQERIEAAMETCELQHKARRKLIGSLSKGFRQRVGIADCLLGDPEVMILDEPTIGLDPHQVLGIRDMLHRLRGKMTILISSHILAEIERACDRVIIINHGRIVAQGSKADLRETFLQESSMELCLEGAREKIEAHLRREASPVSLISVEPDPQAPEHWCCRVGTEGRKAAGPALVDWLREESSIRLHEMKVIEPSLEEIFLAATRKSWKESGEQEGGQP